MVPQKQEGSCDGNEATKRLEEVFLKLPKCLKVMFYNVLSKVSDPTKMQIVMIRKMQA
jgi:hypothetical protein